MNGLNLLVFRDDRRCVSGQHIKTQLVKKLEQPRECSSRDAWTGALLLAGELECGIADCDSRLVASIQSLTDSIADALLLGDSGSELHSSKLESLIAAARGLDVPEPLNISTPEGFAYYALHPLAYAGIMDQICASGSVLVIGIRSIGTTLSAITAAAARARGIEVQRLTVRPQGHPYNRSTEFSAPDLEMIGRSVAAGATFVVVDEGPGLSGSSFLSVAEALERAGAPTDKITMVSGHAPNLDALCAENAACRWQRFRSIPAATAAFRPAEAVDFIGGGQWRSRVFTKNSEWPATWTSFERLKYLSSDKQTERRFFKFAGLGHYGDAVLERERKVAEAGFGPVPREESDGYISHPWIEGRPLSPTDLSAEVLARVADYCAFRVRTFAVERSDLAALQQMADHNLRELGLDLPVDLRLERPVIADGKMQPHEWLLNAEGRLLKSDSGSHGDDHFFPGPTDIAWDLAGAIVEWRMNEKYAVEFLDRYLRASGDDASTRIKGYIKAYVIFRMAYCLMAANATSGFDEQQRLQSAAAEYRNILAKMELRSLCAVQSD